MTPRTVVVTGASRGIGAALARRFAGPDTTVFAVARSLASLAAIVEETGAVPIAADVGRFEDCERIVHHAVDATGRLDILVNNAGCHHRGAFGQLTPRQAAEMVDVNLRAPIVLTRLALPHLLESPRGAVVQIASLAGYLPVPGSSTYSGTKAGLRFFSSALAEELAGTNVSAVCVSPGPVATDFILADLDAVSDLTFSQPMSTPEAVADCVLASIERGSRDAAIPAMSGRLATLGYLMPDLWRRLRPTFARRGQRARDALRRLPRG